MIEAPNSTPANARHRTPPRHISRPATAHRMGGRMQLNCLTPHQAPTMPKIQQHHINQINKRNRPGSAPHYGVGRRSLPIPTQAADIPAVAVVENVRPVTRPSTACRPRHDRPMVPQRPQSASNGRGAVIASALDYKRFLKERKEMVQKRVADAQ